MKKTVAGIAVVILAFSQGQAQAASWEEKLDKVDNTRVVFGHQSVGGNIVDGIGQIYDLANIPGPNIREEVGGANSYWFANLYIGSNGDPESKINDFVSQVNSSTQVAVMKLCYVDITQGSNAKAIFATYKQKISTLQNNYPNLKIVHSTAPLTTGSREDNKVRKQYNDLIRKTWPGKIFDIAKMESTKPGGDKVGGRVPRLYSGYTSDGGHLNSTGSKKLARGLIRAIYNATQR